MKDEGSNNKNIYSNFPGPAATGKFIVELRKEAGYSQEELGKKLFVTRKAISKWENGKGYPSIEIFPALEEVFSVTFRELVMGKRFEVTTPPVIQPTDDASNINFIIKVFRKRQIKQLVIFITIFLLLCLSIFFFENYNSTKIYKVWYEGDDLYIKNGIIVTTRASDYYSFGKYDIDIDDINKAMPASFTLFIKEKDGEKIIFKLNSSNIYISNKEQNEELSKINVKEDLDNLYLRVSYFDKNSVEQELSVKLNTKLYYQSNDIYNLFKEKKSIILDNSNLQKLEFDTIKTVDKEKVTTIDLSFLFNLTEDEIKEKYDKKEIIVNNEIYNLNYIDSKLNISNSYLNFVIYFIDKKVRINIFKNDEETDVFDIYNYDLYIPNSSNYLDLCKIIISNLKEI